MVDGINRLLAGCIWAWSALIEGYEEGQSGIAMATWHKASWEVCLGLS